MTYSANGHLSFTTRRGISQASGDAYNNSLDAADVLLETLAELESLAELMEVLEVSPDMLADVSEDVLENASLESPKLSEPEVYGQ